MLDNTFVTHINKEIQLTLMKICFTKDVKHQENMYKLILSRGETQKRPGEPGGKIVNKKIKDSLDNQDSQLQAQWKIMSQKTI